MAVPAVTLPELRAVLSRTKLKDCWQPPAQGVTCFEHDAKVGDALDILSKYKLLSAPIIVRPDHLAPGTAAASSEIPASSLMGFMDLAAVLKALLTGATSQSTAAVSAQALDAAGKHLAEQPISTLFGGMAGGSPRSVLGQDACSDWARGTPESSLLDALRNGFMHTMERALPSAKQPVVHRLAVFEAAAGQGRGARLAGIFSQSDLVRCLHQRMGDLGELGGRSLHRLSLAAEPPQAVADMPQAPDAAFARVVTVPHDLRTLEAFRAMFELGVSGVGVLDGEGRLVGNLSASDVRCLVPGTFGALLLPVQEFLAERPLLDSIQQETAEVSAMDVAAEVELLAHPENVVQMAPRSPVMAGRVAPPLTVRATSTFAETVALLAENRVHRVYVVDEHNAPHDVVTLTDIVRLLASLCGETA